MSQSSSQLNNTGSGGAGAPGGGPNGTPPSGTAPGAAPTTGGGSTTTTCSGSSTTTTTTTGGGTTTTAGARAVGATLKSARMVRTATGRRRLKVTLVLTEAVTFTATLSRSGKTLASMRVKLAKRTRSLRLDIPQSVHAGGARLRLRAKDADGNVRTWTRAEHVHRKQS